MKKVLVAAALLTNAVLVSNAQTVSTFENIISTKDSTYNGSNGDRGHVSGAAHFWNNYNPAWGSWSGFAFSSKEDSTTAGWTNQYASRAGNGVHGSLSYGVVYSPAAVTFTHSTNGDSIYGLSISNSTYAYWSMKDGDAFAKKFGGTTGNDSDWFFIEITGYNKGSVTNSVKHYLADFRFTDNTKDFIQEGWKWVDLKSLGRVDGLTFTFGSSDVNATWGSINTPTYACIDSLVYMNSSSNFAPVALADGYKTLGSLRSFPILSNDKDPDDPTSSLTVTVVEDFMKGTSQISTSRELEYSPNTNSYGYDTAYYSITDGGSLSDTARVVLLVNEAPIATDDSYASIIEDTLKYNVLNNDTDEFIITAKLSILQNGAFGQASFNNLELVYVPNQGLDVSDSVKYLIEDEFGEKDSAWVRIDLVAASINEFSDVSNSIKVYPNPTSNSLFLELGTELEVRYQIFSLNGVLIEESTLVQGNSVDVSALSPGTYLINVRQGNELKRARFIVK